MTDKLEDDELVERLREILEHYESVNQSYEANHTTKAHGEGVEKLDRPVFQNEEDTLRQAITRLQAAPNPWVKIEDIPEEWKDGRLIDLYSPLLGRVVDCYFLNEHWADTNNLGKSKISGQLEQITHACLSSAPPL